MTKIKLEKKIKRIQFWRMDGLTSYDRRIVTVLEFIIKVDRKGKYLKINNKRVYIDSDSWNFLKENSTRNSDYTGPWKREYYSIYVYPKKYNNNEYPLYIKRDNEYFLNKECLIKRYHDRILSSTEHKIENLDDVKKEFHYLVDEINRIKDNARKSNFILTSKLEYKINIFFTILATILGIICFILLSYNIDFYSVLFGKAIIFIAAIYGIFAYMNSIMKLYLTKKLGELKTKDY